MKLTEVLVSVLISLLILTGLSFTYTTYIKNYSSVINKEKENQNILSVDFEMRKKISVFKVPYWKKTNKELYVLEEELRKIAEEKKCEVFKIEVLKKNNIDIGLAVSWSYLDSKIVTKELFANRVFF